MKIANEITLKHMTLNFSAQHPAAQRVLRLILELDGEVISKADPHIQYFDQLDYVSPMYPEHAFAFALAEKKINKL